MKERQEEESDRNRGDVDSGGRRIDSESAEGRIEEVREHGLADPAECKRGDRDSELGTRYVAIEVLESSLNHFGAAIALGDHLIELAAPGGDEGEFGGHEEPVYGHQSKNSEEAARRRGHRRRVSRLRSNKYKEHMGVIYIVVET